MRNLNVGVRHNVQPDLRGSTLRHLGLLCGQDVFLQVHSCLYPPQVSNLHLKNTVISSSPGFQISLALGQSSTLYINAAAVARRVTSLRSARPKPVGIASSLDTTSPGVDQRTQLKQALDADMCQTTGLTVKLHDSLAAAHKLDSSAVAAASGTPLVVGRVPDLCALPSTISEAPAI